MIDEELLSLHSKLPLITNYILQILTQEPIYNSSAGQTVRRGRLFVAIRLTSPECA
jgi:hypothetical protein